MKLFGLLSLLSYIQNLLHRVTPRLPRGPGPPTSITSQGNTPPDLAIGQSDSCAFLIKNPSSQMTKGSRHRVLV